MSQKPIETVSEFVSEFRDGRLNDEATAKLREVVEAVQITRKKGSVTISFDVSASGDRMVQITPSVKSKIPEEPETGVFYVDRMGNLSRDDPYQERLPMAGIDPSGPRQFVEPVAATPPVFGVDAETGEILHDIPPAPPIGGATDPTPPPSGN